MKFDYSFLEESIHRLRKLRSYSIDKSYLLDAPSRIFPEVDMGMAPRVLEGGDDDPSQVILTRSYARKPGKGLGNLEKMLEFSLPEDFLEFHQLYNEALITTRTYPIYLWNEDKILEGIEWWRDLCSEPIRFIRFGEYWDCDSLYFGLWKQNPESSEWKVAIGGWGDRDQIYEKNIEDEYILAPSFYEWVKSFIDRDGLPDPYMTRFGELEPA